MKAIYATAAAALAVIMMLMPTVSAETSGGMTDFKKITISINYCLPDDMVYEAEADDGGVWLRAYTGNRSGDEKYIYREFYADEAVRSLISEKLCVCDAGAWDGFNGSDPDVSDGSSFTLRIELADGSFIKAYGCNASPANYNAFEDFFTELIVYEEIAGDRFESGMFELTLPEEWAGRAAARYGVEGITFYLTDSGECMLSVDMNREGYTDDHDGAVNAGVLENAAGEKYYVTVRTDDHGIAAEIAGSINGINGCGFIPCDLQS